MKSFQGFDDMAEENKGRDPNLEDLQKYDVIIMSGIPGSGKSTIAKKYFGDRLFCSADYYFGIPYKFVPEEIGQAHRSCMRSFLSTLVGGKANLLIDNTNIEAWEISPYIAVAEAHELKVCVLQINCDPKVAFGRNQHNVPGQTISRMADRLANRRLPPFWTVIQIDN